MVAGSAEQARSAVLAHVQFWNAQDKTSWLALFAEDVTYEDPPGTVAQRGKAVMGDYAWDGSFTATKRWILEPLLIRACGGEAAVHMRNHGSVAGQPHWLDSIEVWTVSDSGLVTGLRAFWEPPTDPDLLAHFGVATWTGDWTLT